MNILEKCQKYHEEEKYDLIIEEIGSIPEEKRTPELDFELARAYNNYANQEDYDSLNEAVRLLLKHKEYFKDNYLFHYRLGYAYFYLDKTSEAALCFEQAYRLNKDDEETKKFLEACYDILECPRFEERFKQRVVKAWNHFLAYEEDIRNAIDSQNQTEVLGLINQALEIAFSNIAFEVGFNGNKYELILTPEGILTYLFEINYFVKHRPKEVDKNWNIIIGKNSDKHSSLVVDDITFNATDIEFKIVKKAEKYVDLLVYSKKFNDIFELDESKAYFVVYNFIDHILGEIPAMSLINSVEIAKEDISDGITLNLLADTLTLEGFNTNISVDEYLNSYTTYQNSPKNTEYWRDDIVFGSTKFMALLNQYQQAETTEIMDIFYKDGIVAGFIAYSLDGLTNDELFDFNSRLDNYIMKAATYDVVDIIGQGMGKNIKYLDFIAWDFSEFMDLMQEFFANSQIKWSMFHSFRPYGRNITLFNRDEDYKEEKKEILGAEQIEYLESCLEDSSGYFYKMYQYLNEYLEKGIEEERFTELEAKEDLNVGLWYAYICNNIGTYEYYLKTVRFMPYSRRNASKSATWYYRYASALIYLSRLDDALRYARIGAMVEAEYPWIWLVLGRLEAHFGNIDKAKEAVNNGLSLVPNDYEFLTLAKEIEEGASIEQMECHWINPDADQELQNNEDDLDNIEKYSSINCIRLSYQGLRNVYKLFNLNSKNYLPNSAYCLIFYENSAIRYQITFKMNEAGLSKINYQYLSNLKNLLDSSSLNKAKYLDNNLELSEVLIEANLDVICFYRDLGNDNYYYKRLNRDLDLVDDLELIG